MLLALALATTVHLTGNEPQASIPLELFQNQPLVSTRINGHGPYWMEVDTGANRTLILDAGVAREAGVATEGSVTLRGAGGEGSAAGANIKQVDLTLPGVEISTTEAVTAPLMRAANQFGHPFHGVIGYGILSNFVVEFDYEHGRLVLHDPVRFHYSGKGTTFPFTWWGRNPQLMGSVSVPGEPPIATRLNIDTGGGGISLPTPFVDEHHILDHVGQTITVPSRGIGGESKYPVGRLSSLTIGPYTFKEPFAALSRDTQGSLSRADIGVNVGGIVLARFKLIVDYAHQQIILEPGAHMRDPFPFDASGMAISADGDDFRTYHVYALSPDSPASSAGLREGDTIESIDGVPARRYNTDELRTLLKAAGKTRRLGIVRDGTRFVAEVKLRRLI